MRYGVLPWTIDMETLPQYEVLRMLAIMNCESQYAEYLASRT